MSLIYRRFFLIPFLLLLCSEAAATPAVIVDSYIGGTPTHSHWVGKDIVGSASLFDVREVWAEITSEDVLEISIVSSYFDNIGQYGTGMGDFFISVDGYNPVADSTLDTALTGESWEYAVVFSEHGEDYIGNSSILNGIGLEGDVSLYSIEDGAIQNSFVNAGIYRADQEVLFQVDDQANAVTQGQFEINDLDGVYSTLSFSLALDGTPLSQMDSFAFHWGMTCGNDVIEGLYVRQDVVPEPATFILLSMALAGRGLRKRAHRK